MSDMATSSDGKFGLNKLGITVGMEEWIKTMKASQNDKTSLEFKFSLIPPLV